MAVGYANVPMPSTRRTMSVSVNNSIKDGESGIEMIRISAAEGFGTHDCAKLESAHIYDAMKMYPTSLDALLDVRAIAKHLLSTVGVTHELQCVEIVVKHQSDRYEYAEEW